MRNKSNYLAVLIVTILFGIASCASTHLTNSYRDKNYNTPIHKMLVIGLSEDMTKRRIFEDTLAARLGEQGIEAVSSAKVIPVTDEINRTTVKAAIEGQGFDTVLVTRLISINEQTTAAPGAEYVVPHRYYGNLYDYYDRVSPSVRSPDYLLTDRIVSLETNVYETGKGDLIWAIKSETFNPVDIKKEITSLTDLLVKKMVKDGLL